MRIKSINKQVGLVDDILNEADRITEKFRNLDVGNNRRLIEDYKEGRLAIHFHFSKISSHISDDGDRCAIFNTKPLTRIDAKINFLSRIIGRNKNLKWDTLWSREGCYQQPVFVGVVNLGKSVEPVITSTVRFQPLNKCNSLKVHSRYFPVEIISEFFEAGIDRKGGGGNVCGWVLEFNQSAGEMVKSGTQVMRSIADDKCPFFERWVNVNREFDFGFVPFGVFLNSGSVRIATFIPINRNVKIVEMLLCPVEFGNGT